MLRRVLSSIRTTACGSIDALNAFANIRLVWRSSRVKTFIKSSFPAFALFALVNFLYHTYRSHVSYFTTFLYYSVWFLPAYILCNIYLYYTSHSLWESVNAKTNATTNTSTNTKLQQSRQRKDSEKIKDIAEVCYGLILSMSYVILTSAVWLCIPSTIIASVWQTVTCSWAISWTVFENRFISEGKDLVKRIRHFERRWMYFMGFGLPLALGKKIFQPVLWS
jgi:hypothetical protein